jgi:hypothetical protein
MHIVPYDNAIDLYGQALLLLAAPAPGRVFALQELAAALMRKQKFVPSHKAR